MESSVNEVTPVSVPVTARLPDEVIAPQAKAASVSVKSPVNTPVCVVVANLNVSVVSTQPIKAVSADPLSITIPESPLGASVSDLPVPNSIS